ncbi:MAG: ATP-dependent helicase, partial [Lentisphaerae bacterium]|nr:ATP-dependent helicase [Lentisphaerota bacterium]
MRIDYKKALNPEQYAAVTAPDKPAYVLAAAGTGKTRTLVFRVAYLVEQGVTPQRVLLLTFTNKAAREMLERAEDLVVSGVGGLWGGIFHHKTNRVLRRDAHLLKYDLDYTILDQDDAKTLMRNCVSDLNLKSKDMPKPEVILSMLSSARNSCMSVDRVIEKRFEEHPIDAEDILLIINRYGTMKRKNNAMDFDDLLLNALELFRDHEGVCEKYSEQFKYVLVDEYQDTNPIQSEWVDLMGAVHRNIMVVGDDFQSIYSWRGADYTNIMTFPERYPDALKFSLETNYRSAPEILDVANVCIAGNPYQFQKTLLPTRSSKGKPVVATMRDGDAQARYIIEQIRQCRKSGIEWNEMAVLYRAHFHALELQMNLAKERIPYTVTSGMRFFEQAHIKDVTSLLKLLETPNDGLSFNRLLNLIPGVGPKTAERIWDKLGNKFDHSKEARELLAVSLPARAKEVWSQIDSIIDLYEQENLNEDPGEVIFQFTKIFYDKYMNNTFDNYQRRKDDVQELITFTSSFESTSDFLSEMALASNMDSEPDRNEDNMADTIRLSTVHQAKGLEWKVVFVIWVSEGMFPSSRTLLESSDD